MADFEWKKLCSFCHSVGIPHFGPAPFRRCSKCKLAYYCSEDCQRKDWKANHKQIHDKNKTQKHPVCCEGFEDPDSLEMRQIEGAGFGAEHNSVIESIGSLVVLSMNLCNKSVFTMDESFNGVLQWMMSNLQKISHQRGCDWRKASNSLSTLEVLYHYPLNSIFRFGSGMFPWWESYIVSFGRVKRAVDLLASLADSGTRHSGNFAEVVVRLVLPEAVVDKRGNNMLYVKLARSRHVGSKEGITCFSCRHEVTGKLRPAFDPQDVANFHDAALVYPLQRPVYIRKNTNALRPEEVLSQLLALGEVAPVFCNFVCDMTLRLQEAEKVLDKDKPAFHLKPGTRCRDILETMCSKTVESMFNKEDMFIMMMGNLMGNEDLDRIQYRHSKREKDFMDKSMMLKKSVNNLIQYGMDSDVIKSWSDTIFDINSLIQQTSKYTVTCLKTVLDEILARAYFNRGKIHHKNKSYLKAINDFQRVWSFFQLKHRTRNIPPYKVKCLPELLEEGLEAKCRLAEIYSRLGNMKTALSEVSECAVCIENASALMSGLGGLGRLEQVSARISAVYINLHEMPLVINVESLAKRKSDKALSYFGCDWQSVSVGKVFDKKHQPTVFEETACHTATFLDNTLYILGGTSLHDERLNTYRPRNLFWSLDLQSCEMLQLEAPKKVVCRNSHSCAAYNGCLYVYGGDHAKSINMTVDDHKTTWMYCVSTGKWTPLKTTGNSPLTTGHGACVVNGKMYIFGGEPVNVLPPKCKWKKSVCLGCVLSSDTDLNDLHVLDLETLEWKKLSGTGGINPKFLGENLIPEGRHYPIMWGDQESRRIFILSGAGHRANVPHKCETNHDVYEKGNFHYDDFWQYSLDDDEWTKLKLHGNIPVARGETQAAAVKGGAVIFGGYTIQAKALVKRQYFQESQYLQDSFEFRYDKMAFRQIFTEHQPNPRAMFGLVADPTRRDKIYLVGGRGNTSGLSSENKAMGKKTKRTKEKLPKGVFLTEGIIYGDIWELDLSAGEAPGVNIDEVKDEMFCKVCEASSSRTRLYQCSGCMDPHLRYCSKPCIAQDWPNHKRTCLEAKASKGNQASEEEKQSQRNEEEVD